MMKNVRMSRKIHEVPRRENEMKDISGFRGTGDNEMTQNTGLDNGQLMPRMPKKAGTFATTKGEYGLTDLAKPAEVVDNGREGVVRGRQADKHK